MMTGRLPGQSGPPAVGRPPIFSDSVLILNAQSRKCNELSLLAPLQPARRPAPGCRCRTLLQCRTARVPVPRPTLFQTDECPDQLGASPRGPGSAYTWPSTCDCTCTYLLHSLASGALAHPLIIWYTYLHRVKSTCTSFYVLSRASIILPLVRSGCQLGQY